jgi:ubiquitin carboxyl-terminal hydrolase 2
VELKRVIGKVASRFTGYDQQDAQEFLRFLLDGLHEDLNRVLKKPPYYEIKDRANARDREVSDEYWKFYADRNHSALSDLFCGQLRSEIQCHTCQHRSLCFDVFWDLSVPVPKKPKPSGHHLRMFASSKDNSSPSSTSSATSGCSIQECLKAYTDQECLDDSDSYYCAKCKTHRAVSKKISLYRLPEVLVIHLKRFAYSTFSRDKVTTAIQIPQHGLDVSACCAQDAVLDGSTLYDLAGVVHHVGSLSGGHYTACVWLFGFRMGMELTKVLRECFHSECLNADTSEWYDFNDATVSPVKKPQLTSASAYILFFRRRAEKSLTI